MKPKSISSEIGYSRFVTDSFLYLWFRIHAILNRTVYLLKPRSLIVYLGWPYSIKIAEWKSQNWGSFHIFSRQSRQAQSKNVYVLIQNTQNWHCELWYFWTLMFPSRFLFQQQNWHKQIHRAFSECGSIVSATKLDE